MRLNEQIRCRAGRDRCFSPRRRSPACATTSKPPDIDYDERRAEATGCAAEPPLPVEDRRAPASRCTLPAASWTPSHADGTCRPETAEPASVGSNVPTPRLASNRVRDGLPSTPSRSFLTARARSTRSTASPGQITDIALQPGESLVGSGPIAAGDTARWIIGDTESGSGESRRIHVLVKPTRPDLTTNLVVNTDRRTYHLELRATPSAYMASVSWTYAEDALIALRRRNAEAEAALPIGREVALEDLRFRYRIEGDRPPWRPVRAFDDGRQVFIEFPRGIGQGEMPPLFVIGAQGEGQLVNYRIRRNYMVVDRLFAAAELRLGDRQRVVRIERTDGVRRTSSRRDETVVSAWRPERDR